MRLLVLGGTEFVGRAVVEDGLARGWEVTTFNRGTSPAQPGVTALSGDRTVPGGLTALEAGEWDIVVDTWSWAPSAVGEAARLLSSRVTHYVYISSRSVYRFPPPLGATEDVPIVQASPDDDDHADYARAKAGGEMAAVAALADRALLARAGLILGPYENVGRLPWWLDRVARGGAVLAPGPPDANVQFVDARDLATFILDLARDGIGGPFDVVSPLRHATMREVLEACCRATGSGAELCWVDPEPILAAGVQPWTELPLWLPPGEFHDGMHRSDVSRAVAAGLRCRPVTETVADTWAWLQSIGGQAPQRPDRPSLGLAPEVEARLLEAWANRG